MATVELVNVAHSYDGGTTYAVRDINLTWEDGVASALLGPSGCGKTTLLKIISGLLKPSEGQVLIDGQDVTAQSPRERNVAQVFQFPVVYETLNVYNNLAFPLRNRGVDEAEVDRNVRAVAEMLELTPYLKKRANRLGAAEKQRISMGRGIVRSDTTAVLFDEPLTIIDPHQKWHLRRKLKELHQRLNLTMIYVTHDQHEALTFADQVTVMDAGEALQTASPEELHTQPAAPFVGYFIGSPGMNLFEGKVVVSGIQLADYHLALATDLVEGSSVQVGIRPEYIQVSKDAHEGWFAATVTRTMLTGNALMLELASDSLQLKAIVPEESPLQAGETVYVHFPHDKVLLYSSRKDGGKRLETQVAV
ncbi:MAG: ABC transporter ATP-binding protein [Deinococcota bacterium]